MSTEEQNVLFPCSGELLPIKKEEVLIHGTVGMYMLNKSGHKKSTDLMVAFYEMPNVDNPLRKKIDYCLLGGCEEEKNKETAMAMELFFEVLIGFKIRL
jgi:hypothetical protein